MAFVLGEVAVALMSIYMVILFITGIVLLLCLIYMIGKYKNIPVLLFVNKNIYFHITAVLMFLTGSVAMFLSISKTPIESYIDEGGSVSIKGRIEDITDSESGYVLYIKTSYIEGRDYSYSGRLKIKACYVEDEIYKIDDIVSINGDIRSNDEVLNYGQMDFLEYNKSLGISFSVDIDDITIDKRPYISIRNNIYMLRHRFKEAFGKIYSEEDRALVMAMVIGDKSSLADRTSILYRKAGITHIMAISGLHVSLVGLSIFKLIRKRKQSYIIAFSISTVVIISYGILTGLNISCFRAIVMLIIYGFGQVIGHRNDIVTALCISALIQLLTNPYTIYNTGFLLSYGAVIAIGLVYPIFENACGKKHLKTKNIKSIKRNQFSNSKTYIIKVSKVVALNALKKLLSSLIMSLSINLVTFPILANTFYEISIYSPIYNLIVIPLMSILLPFAILSGILSMICTPIAYICAYPVKIILKIYMGICIMNLKIPGNTWTVGHIDFIKVILYILIILLMLCALKMNKKKLILVFLGALFITFSIENDRSYIGMCYMGQGEGIIIKTRDGAAYLIDGGSSSHKNAGKYMLLPSIKYQGISSLECIFISHTDSDHINSIEYMLDNYIYNSLKIKNIAIPYCMRDSEAFQNIKTKALKYKINIIYVSAGDLISKGNTSFTIIAPDEYIFDDVNDNSMVMLVDIDGFKMLSTGDIGSEGGKRLKNYIRNYKKSNQINVDVLKVPHHGGKSEGQLQLFEAIDADYGIISCGVNNSYGHPSNTTINNLKASDYMYYVTSEVGTIDIIINKDGSYSISNIKKLPYR